MATDEQVAALKRIGPATTRTDDELSALIDDETLNGAAAVLWEERAVATASMVNVSESGSSRSLGDVHKNALSMAEFFRQKVAAETAETAMRPRTRNIVRA